jgi:hypothetical protein
MEDVVSGMAGLPSNLDQDGLHGEVTLPLAQAGELVKFDLDCSVSAITSDMWTSWQDIPCRFSDLRRAG